MIKKHNIIEIEGIVGYETDAAFLFSPDSGDEVWLPKSLCDFSDGVMQLPEWLAADRGLI